MLGRYACTSIAILDNPLLKYSQLLQQNPVTSVNSKYGDHITRTPTGQEQGKLYSIILSTSKVTNTLSSPLLLPRYLPNNFFERLWIVRTQVLWLRRHNGLRILRNFTSFRAERGRSLRIMSGEIGSTLTTGFVMLSGNWYIYHRAQRRNLACAYFKCRRIESIGGLDRSLKGHWILILPLW